MHIRFAEKSCIKSSQGSNKIFPTALIYFSKFLEGKIRLFRSHSVRLKPVTENVRL